MTWAVWEEPDCDRMMAYWKERDIHVVFPLHWGQVHGHRAILERAKQRVTDIETKAGGRHIVPGSVLLAFSRHGVLDTAEMIDPEVPRGIV